MSFLIGEGHVRVTVDRAGAIAGLGAITAAAGVAGAALAALPALGASVAGIGGVLAGSFAGVGDALKGYQADQKAATKTGAQSAAASGAQARQIRDAQQAIDTARRNSVKVAKDSADRIADALANEAKVAADTADKVNDAREDQRRVAEDVADAIEDAQQSQAKTARQGAEAQEKASERVKDALNDERDAQDDLAKAREYAAASLDDLREKVSDYGLTEEDAAIRVERAREDLLKTEGDASASALDLREARNDLAQAEERLSDVQRERAKDTAELAKQEALGIDGSEKVVDAQKKLVDAQDKVAEAQREASRTAVDVAEANSAAAEKVAEAVSDGARKQQDAAEKVADAVADGAERQQEAAKATAKAQEEGAAAQQDAARAVAEAVEGLDDAQASASESAGTATAATSAYADAMKKLHPEQKKLVEQLLAMGPLVTGLRDASSESFLPGLTSMLKDSEGLFPIFEGHLRRTGDIMGDTAIKMGDLFKSDEFKKNLDALFKSSDPITKAIGDSLVRMTDKLVEFGAKMSPASQGFATFVDDVTIGLEGFFTNLEPYAEDFKSIWESLGRIFKVVLPAVGTAIGEIAEMLAPVLDKIADFLETHKDDIDEMIIGILGLYAAIKGAGVIVGVTKMVTGVIKQWNRLPAGAKKAVGKALLVLAALDVARGAAEGYTPEQNDQFEQGGFGSDLGVFGQEAAKDPLGALGKEIRASLTPPEETKQLWAGFSSWWGDFWGKTIPDAWRNTWEGPNSLGATFSSWGTRLGEDAGRIVGDIGTWFSGLGGTVAGWFTDMKDRALAKFDEFRDWAGTKAGEIVTNISTFLSELPGKVVGFFLGMKDQALLKLDEFRDWAGTKATEIRDKIAGFLGELPGKVAGFFTGMKDQALLKLDEFRDWAGTKSQELRDRVSTFISELPGRVLGFITNMKDGALAKFDEFRDWAGTKAGELRDRVSTFISELPGRITNFFIDMKDRALGKLDDFRNWAGTKATELRDRIMGGINSLPDTVRDVFQRVKDWAIGKLNELRDAAKAPIDFVVNTVYTNGIKPVWNGIARVFNMPQLATGGILPGYTPGRDVHVAALSGGEAVMRPEWTRAVGANYVNGANAAAKAGGVAGASQFVHSNGLPGYADGGIIGDIWNTASGFVSSLMSGDPAAAVRGLFGGVLGDSDRTPGKASEWRDAAMKVAPKTIDGIVEKAKTWAKDMLSSINIGGSGVDRWAGMVGQALGIMGQPQSLIPTVLRRMNQESGGDPTIVNKWDSNWLRGTPSVGLMQVIGPTYRANRHPSFDTGPYSYGVSVNPLANTLASMRYAMGRYGSLPAAYNKAGGYDQGGVASGMGMLPKFTPRPERVLSPQQTEAFERAVDGGFRGSGDTYNVNVTIPARDLAEMRDVTAFFDRVQQVARSNRAERAMV